MKDVKLKKGKNNREAFSVLRFLLPSCVGDCFSPFQDMTAGLKVSFELHRIYLIAIHGGGLLLLLLLLLLLYLSTIRQAG